jgi:hypothetical protein
LGPYGFNYTIGNITANTFLGTINAANVFSGQFGQNTGGGNYYFMGNVGIGTTTPSQKLTVAGKIDVTGNRIVNLATPIDSNDAATKGYVDAQSGSGGVCYTNYRNSTCASGFTAVLTGYTTIYMSSYFTSYTMTSGGLACSSIRHDFASSTSFRAYGISREYYFQPLDNEPCVICCK